MSEKRKYIIFFLIVATNVFLKAIFSDYSPFSYDEIISVKNTLLDFGHIKHEAEWDNNPPFYYYCLWVWHQAIPITEYNSRFLSVLFVAFSIGLTFLFASKYFNVFIGISTALLLSLSNFITYYSQETRTYSLILLLAVASSILFFKYLNKPTLFNLLFLSLINFLLIYSHYISGLVLVVQYLFIILFNREKIRLYLPIQTGFITLLVFLRFTKKQIHNIFNFNHKDDFWLKPSGLEELLNALSELFYNNLTAVVFSISGLIFIFGYVKGKREDIFKIKLYCFALGFLSILVLFLIGTFKALFLPRYLIFCIPFATIVIVYQVLELKLYGRYLILALICLQLFFIELRKKSGMDYRSIAQVIKANKSANDAVIINTRDNLLLFQYYYNRNNFMKYKNLDSISKVENIFGINTLEKLQEVELKPNNFTYLIQSFHKIRQENNIFKEVISKDHTNLFTTNSYQGIEFTVFRN